ncbi:hypothetical protein Tco_0831445 [Tanacetum coccineum]
MMTALPCYTRRISEQTSRTPSLLATQSILMCLSSASFTAARSSSTSMLTEYESTTVERTLLTAPQVGLQKSYVKDQNSSLVAVEKRPWSV